MGLARFFSDLGGTMQAILRIGGPNGLACAPTISVATPAVLNGVSQLTPVVLQPGQWAYVQSLKNNFYLDPTSVANPDNITVIAALGGGNWLVISSGSSGGGGLSAPVNIAAGSTTNMGHNDPNYHNIDLTGAAPTINLDTAPSGGQKYRAKNKGLGVQTANIVARGNMALEDPANPGHYTAANGTVLFGGVGNGEWVEWIFNAATSQWQLSDKGP